MVLRWLRVAENMEKWWLPAMVEREWLVREEASWRLLILFYFLKNIESMASVSLQPRQKRDLWLRVMTEAKRGAFWPRFNMPRFLNRSRISKITGAKRGYCTSVLWFLLIGGISIFNICKYGSSVLKGFSPLYIPLSKTRR